MPFGASALVSKTSAALVATVGLVSGVVGLLYSDMFNVTASLTPVVTFQTTDQADPQSRVLNFGFVNNSDLPMQNAFLYFGLYDASGTPLYSADQDRSELDYFVPLPMQVAARQHLIGTIAPDDHPDVLDTSRIYFCGSFDGRVWFSRVTETFVLKLLRDGTFGQMAYDRKVRLFAEAGCPDMRSEDIDFPRLSVPAR